RDTAQRATDWAKPALDALIAAATCELWAAQAALSSRDNNGKPDKLDEVLVPATEAKTRFEDILTREPSGVVAIEGLGAALKTLGDHHYRDNTREAEKHYTPGVELLTRVARNNPQNDDIAALLNELLDRQIAAYKAIGRTELAAASAELRV